MIKRKQDFIVGLDWLITDENKPFLLEFNMSREEEGNDTTYSKPFHFFQVSLDKLLQHQLIGDFMPDYTKDKEDFDEFINRKKKVVYKKGSGSQGSGVSVLERPDWEPDFLEEFMQPKVQLEEGKSYPYVIRDYQMITAKSRDFSWRRKEVFRKQSRVALEDSKSYNDALKLNTSRNANRSSATTEEEQLTLEKTNEVMNRIRKQGKRFNWNPTKIYDSAIVGYYLGYRIAMFGGYPDYFPEVAQLLREKSIGFIPFGFSNGLSRAIKASKYGTDMTILTNYHSIKWCELRTRYRLRRNANRRIEHVCGDRVFETYPSRENIIINGEFNPTEIANKIAENYQKRKR